MPRSVRTAPCAMPEFARDQRAGEIAREIGGAKINCFPGAEPFCGDQGGNQRRIGEAGKSEPDQRSTQARRSRKPGRPALAAVAGRSAW